MKYRFFIMFDERNLLAYLKLCMSGWSFFMITVIVFLYLSTSCMMMTRSLAFLFCSRMVSLMFSWNCCFVSGEEYCVIGFGWIWNKVVGVEVVDEVVEF